MTLNKEQGASDEEVKVWVPLADPPDEGMLFRLPDVNYSGRKEYILKEDYDRLAARVDKPPLQSVTLDTPECPEKKEFQLTAGETSTAWRYIQEGIHRAEQDLGCELSISIRMRGLK